MDVKEAMVGKCCLRTPAYLIGSDLRDRPHSQKNIATFETPKPQLPRHHLSFVDLEQNTSCWAYSWVNSRRLRPILVASLVTQTSSHHVSGTICPSG